MYRSSSPYNRDIRVILESGKYKLIVNGARESGAFNARMWKPVMANLGIADIRHPEDILMLGVAGGTIIRLLHDVFPRAQITGVEIDQEMLHIGKTYFGLKDIPWLSCIREDAKEFVAGKNRKHYGLIVVDVFSGPDVPDFVAEETFQTQVRDLVSPGGALVINYIRDGRYGTLANSLGKILKTLYPRVRFTDTYNNRIFLAIRG